MGTLFVTGIQANSSNVSGNEIEVARLSLRVTANRLDASASKLSEIDLFIEFDQY